MIPVGKTLLFGVIFAVIVTLNIFSLKSAQATDNTTLYSPQLATQQTFTLHMNAITQIIDPNAPADCPQRCYLGYASCVRDKLPPDVTYNNMTPAALAKGREVAGQCARFIEGYCYALCPTIKRQLDAIRAARDLAGVSIFSEEWQRVWQEVDEMCEDRAPVVENTCFISWMRNLLPHIQTDVIGDVIDEISVSVSDTGELWCPDQCWLQGIVCERESLPDSITGTEFTVGQHMEASAQISMCEDFANSCNVQCQQCAICENLDPESHAALYQQNGCGDLRCE